MINSNVPLDFKAESGTPYWKERGADTWYPFKTTTTKSTEITARVRTQGGNFYTMFLELLIAGSAVSSVSVGTSNDGKFSKPSKSTSYTYTVTI